MKPFLALSLLACLACSSCSTLANRRDLYRPLKAKKPTTSKSHAQSPTPATPAPAQ